jgi:hypothetical protein
MKTREPPRFWMKQNSGWWISKLGGSFAANSLSTICWLVNCFCFVAAIVHLKHFVDLSGCDVLAKFACRNELGHAEASMI